VTDADLRALRKTVRQVERAEGLVLGNSEPDPRPKLQRLGRMLGRFQHEQSTQTIKNLLREWGATSPSALEVARSLANVLELWARTLVEEIGLLDNGPPAEEETGQQLRAQTLLWLLTVSVRRDRRSGHASAKKAASSPRRKLTRLQSPPLASGPANAVRELESGGRHQAASVVFGQADG
jgi:hypothetical protein